MPGGISLKFVNTTDGSGTISLDHVLAIVAYSASSSSFSLAVRPATTAIHSGNDTALGSVYTTKAAAANALGAFLGEVGFPWVGVGTIPDPVSSGSYVVAVNLANIAQVADSTGTGVSFNSGAFVSHGYDPWADGPTAIAALLELAGSPVDLP